MYKKNWKYCVIVVGMFMSDNGASFDLYELLEHKELFLNYPDIRDSKVLFTRLNDGQPYHFYWNKDEGYVFEIDAEQCDYSLMRDLLLKGTNFAVQHKEGFDYTLSPKQRKNYMDRHLYMAKKMLEKENKTRLKDFLITHNLYKNYWDIYKYWDKHDMPVSMVNIYKSERVDENNIPSFDLINYRDINFDRLTNDILKQFSLENDEKNIKLKKQALADLFLFKEMVNKNVMYTVRLESGYKDIGLPWSGVVSQGIVDEGAMFNRLLPQKYMTSTMKKMYNPTVNYDSDFEMLNRAELTKGLIEERNRFENDVKALDFMTEKAAKGAYDFGNNIIALFDGGDAETIAHETFHYFYDFLEKNGHRDNMFVRDVFDIISEIKADFLGNHRIIMINDKYYAMPRDSFEPIKKHPIGYEDKDELLDKIAKEIFVERMLRTMDGKNVNMTDNEKEVNMLFNMEEKGNVENEMNPYLLFDVDKDKFDRVSSIYGKWLNYMLKALDINKRNLRKGVRKVLKNFEE